MPTDPVRNALNFLRDGGEMGALMRAHDWSASSLGQPEAWPQSLRTAVRLILNTRHPMYLFWGEHALCFYNDAYSQSLGPERHPSSLGQPARQVWAEIWELLGPQLEQVMAGGEATWFEDQAMTVTRNDAREEVYWTYSCSPVDDDGAAGGIGGVLVVCNETTAHVLSEQRRSLERDTLAQLFEQAPTFMAVLRGPEQRFELANPGYMRLVGDRPVIGRTVAESLPEAVDQGYLRLLEEVFDSGQAYSANGAAFAVQLSPNGPLEERFVDFVYQPIKDKQGKVTGIFVEGVDVTVRVQADQALRQSEALMRLVVESASDYAILTTDLGGYITSWSAGAERIFGWTNDEIHGRKASVLFTERDRAYGVDEHELLRAARDGCANDERWHVCKDGSQVFMRGSVHPLPADATGSGQGFLKIARNETERRHAEARSDALVRLSDSFRALRDPAAMAFAAAEILGQALDLSRAGYGTIDAERELLRVERDWNAQGSETLVGELHLRAYGSFIDDLKRGEVVTIDDVSQDPRTAPFAAAIRGHNVRALVNVPVIEHGQLVAMLYLNSADVRQWSDQDLAFIQEMADRTRMAVERSRGELALREANETLEAKVEARTRDLMRAEEALGHAQKMEAVGQLTGGVAHDFNNLLTVIKSSTDLLKRRELPHQRRERYVEAISDTVDRAARLTGQLLAFARRQALQPEVFEVGQSVQTLAEMVGTLTGSRIGVSLELPQQPCFINADPSQFDTAVVNMAVNARDAMNGEGQLTIVVAPVSQVPGSYPAIMGDYVAVSLRDTGEGISKEQIGQVFEPFFTTKGVGQGTGLGLSQVFGFAKQSGGEVQVSSEPGQGATFTLFLPRVAAAPAAAPVAEPAELVDGHGTRVLMVEDNPQVGGCAVQTLSELGYVPTWANNAREALEVLAKDPRRFDVVFSDVIMPGMNGIELAQEIRRLYPTLPVVLTSGYSHVLAQQGTHGFELLHKPYSVEQLSRILRKAVV
ncbi:PAS domain-containing protein [Pseudomonas sp. nanlin1]|uniref:PAS domain-containing hybrid sensor histidine kinase/response regulator n=1 Tax=Pseudomonas sp. nanlin1 TaxID=3040605 RepID=UPI00388EA48D